jgi:lactoylglutathione lyase
MLLLKTAFATVSVLAQACLVSSFGNLGNQHRSRTPTFLRAEATEQSIEVVPGRPTWQQAMLRISDPEKSIPFYTDVMGMTVIDTLDFPQWNFKLFFLTTLPEGEKYDLIPGTKEAHDYMWSIEGTALELTYNYGTEKDDFEGYHPGNEEKDGFGHIAFNTDDVYAACEKLEDAGVTFKKKPDEGRMKGLAFAHDPDGYWVEIVKRKSEAGKIPNYFNFSQTMLRIKDPKKSIPFYEAMGMKLVMSADLGDFSLYYLASNVDDDFDLESLSTAEAMEKVGKLFGPVLELTHNHGTEDDDDFKHYSGNEEGRQGFGHIGFLVDDVYKACDGIREMGYGFKKEPDGGSMKGLAFAWDPDGYPVEIIHRGGIEFGDKRVESP